jgi:oxygen-independent coproporphyrinogen-3 oxidase
MRVQVPGALLAKYDRPGPRYTSYPTVPAWTATFGEADYRRALRDLGSPQGGARSAADAGGLCVYLHLPFCARRCHYCGCNALDGCGRSVVGKYLDHLERELDLITGILGRRRAVQIHWGGGTPNFLSEPQLRRAMGLLRNAFIVTADAEISLETDPRLGTPEQARLLRELGFARVSLGVQDIDPAVQEAIGRVQPAERTRRFYEACREAGFASVNLDLVYGLPRQTPASLARTLDFARDLDPDRIACFGYAHVPWVRPNQEKVDTTDMPTGAAKFALFQQALDTFADTGYEWIGMDHFARPADELAVAARERRLHRNFMGYTTRPAADLLALGMSGISELAGAFAQNDPDLAGYQEALDEGHLPVIKGHRLSADDRLRRLAITHLMCNLELPWDLAAAEFGVRLDAALADDLERMAPLVEDGLVVREPDRLLVTDLGRFFVRNICMELDAYLPRETAASSGGRPIFSRTV